MTMTPIFNRPLLRMRRSRATQQFLQREIESRLQERVSELRRTFACELHIRPQTWQARRLPLTGDEECLPFAPNSFDLITACGQLHGVNDLPGCLAQIHRCLKPGGVFLAIFPGGETLHELRETLLQAEAALGRASPHISPFVDIRDAAALLQRAKFANPVADVERLTVEYADMRALMHDLRAMGEANALAQRPNYLRRDVLAAAEKYYRQHFSTGGRITATFDLMGMMGMK